LSKRRNFILLLFVLLLTGPALLGQSALQFPRVISTSGLYTGIAVGNPNLAEASVTFTAFQPDGSVLSGAGVHNPVTVTIPPAGQYARLFPEVFGVSSFNGWVQAASSTSGLTGFFINGNNALTDLNGAGSNSPATDVILPLMSEDSVARTEVTVVNVNTGTTSVTMTLYSAGGSIVVTKNITLGARSLVRQTLGSLLSISDLSAASHLRVQSDRPVIAHELVADFQIPGSTLRRETGALTGHAASSATTYSIPQFATGGGWLSLIGVVNTSGLAQDVTLTAYKEDGTLWPGASNPKSVTLQGNAALRTTVGDLFGFSSANLSTGWIKVSSTQGFVTSYIGYGNALTPSFALVEATPAGDASRFAVFSHVAEGAGFYTGLAVLNPGTVSADVEFYTLRADGSTVGRSTLTVGPGQRVSRLFRELLPASLEQVGGWGYLRSSQPVVGAVLFGTSNGYALANVPQQLPAGDFLPPAQTTGTITGTVRSGGAGVSGVQIALTGPVNTVRVTDDAGRYVFTQLPTGSYKVVATRLGAVVVPSERNVTVNKTNVDSIDFEAGGITSANVPTIGFITPASAFVGNSSLNLRIFGTNFTPASVVRVNDVPAPTTFVNSVELNAVVAASLLGKAGTLRVNVDTPPPGGGASPVFSFTVNNVPSDPLIAGLAPVGAFPAGVVVDAVRHRALVTNQSADSVTVLSLPDLQFVAEIRVGRNPAEGIDIHPEKDIALVANVGNNNVSVIDLKTNTATRTINVGHFPVGLAINPVTNRAYVVNGEDNNVSVINLDTFESIGLVPVGARPSDIAINTRTNQAVVTNRGANSVSILDLNSGTSLGTIPVGEFPRGVAINPNTSQAVVVNAASNSITIINLESRQVVGTMNVGAGPTSVAIHNATNAAVISNSAITRTSPNAVGVSTVSIVNLDRREDLATVVVGSAPFGVAIDQDQQLALVANYNSNNLTAVRIPNAVPQISDIEPKTFPAGGGSFTITVKGSGFVPSSVLTLNGKPLPTTFVSSKELRGVISAAMVDQLLQVHSASDGTGKGLVSAATIEFNVGVENPGPGGGGNPPSTSGSNQIQPTNLAPLLLSISPTEIQVGTTDLLLTLSGTNFNATSVINFAGFQFSPTSSSLTTMTALVPKNQLVAGNVAVSVTNPPPGGGTSAPLNFKVNAVENPAPTVATVTPSSIPAGAGATNVVVVGTGFIASTTGTLAGTAGVLSSGNLTFALSAAQTSNAGTLNGIVSNPAPGGGSANFSVSILNPVPTVGGFTPDSAAAGSSPVTIQVSGTNLGTSSQILIADTPIPTTFVPPTTLTGAIASSFMTAPTNLSVGIRNPGPGGGTAPGGVFRVLGAPTLSSIAPATGAPGAAVPVTLTGTNFAPGATVTVSGTGVTVGSVSVASSTSLTATFTIGSTAASTARSVNVSTTAGTSTAVTFTVIQPPPVLTSISPASALQGTFVPVVLTGDNFIAGATVSAGAGITVGGVTITSPTSISTSFSIDPTAPLGSRAVAVTTAGGTSGSVDFTVGSAAPTLLSLSVDHATQGETVVVNLTGTNFLSGAAVSVSGAGVSVTSTTLVSSTSISAGIVFSLTAPTGTRTLTVTTAGGAASLPFLVTSGTDIVAGFSTTQNPNGVWSLGFTPTQGGALTLYDSNASFSGDPAALKTWSFTALGTDPAASKNVGAADFVYLNVLHPVDMIHIHPGPAGQYSVIRWRAPSAGAYSIVGAFKGLNPHPTTTDVHILFNSATSLFDLNINNYNVPTPFSIIKSLNTGDTIDFVVGRGIVPDYGFDSTGVSGTITPVTLASPTLSAISPASGVQGTSFGVTLTGTNFVSGAGATTVAVSGSGVSAGSVNVTSATSLTATLTIAAGATLGLHDVTVTTSAGTSAAVPFNVASSFGGSVFTGGVSTNWSDPANWFPSGVPGPTASALIPASATRMPILTANISVLNLTVETGATLDSAGFTITIGGSIDGGSTIIGGGLIDMTGTGTIRGSLPNVRIGGNITSIAATTTTITGNLAVISGFLDVGGTVTATGNFDTSATGILRMVTVGGALSISGNATFNGGSTSGQLTAGSLFVRGAFSAGSSSSTNFAPSGTHATVLNGTASQTVNLTFPGAANQAFQNLSVNNAAGVVFGSSVQVNSGTTVNSGNVTGSTTATLAGNLTDAVGGRWQVANTTLSGSPTVIPAAMTTNLTVSGTILLNVNLTLTGNLTITGSVDVSATNTTVTGNLDTTGSGVLRMQSVSGVLTVNGNATFNGGSTAGLLTAGTLNLRRAFSAGVSSLTNFVATGTHTTRLDGTSSQAVSMTFPSPGNQRFQNLQVTNTAGIVMSAGVQAGGNVDVAASVAVTGSGPLVIGGNLTSGAGSSITPGGVTLAGSMAVLGVFSPTTTTFNGTAQTIQSGLGYQQVIVSGTAAFSNSSPTTVTSTLSITGGSLDISSATVTVSGGFAVSGSGILRMQNASGVLNLLSSAVFGGGDTTGFLSAGTLNVRGAFSAGGSSFTNFAASGTHTTVLNGTSAQTVSMTFPGLVNQRFQNLQIANTAGVVFSTNTQVNGALNIGAGTGISGAGTLTAVGNLTTGAGSTITITGLTLGGSMTVAGTFSPTTTTFNGAGQTIQDGLGYQNVVVDGGVATFSSLGPTTLTGNLTAQNSGVSSIGAATVNVTGNLSTITSGVLRMQSGGGSLTVSGNASFNGGSTTGQLTAGSLNVRGTFSAGSSSFTDFDASGTHLTTLSGTLAQSVSMAFPAPGQQHFNNLQISNPAGVAFTSNTQINGNLDVVAALALSGTGTVTVVGNLSTVSGSSVTTTGLTLAGTMTVLGSFSPGTATFNGAGQLISAGLGYQNVVVAGTAAFSSSVPTVVTGDLTVSSGVADIAGANVSVIGNLTTSSTGALQMQIGTGVLTVNGATSFNGGSTATLLTAGTLNLRGSFSAGSSSFTSFAASGTHTTVLNGTISQAVSMAFPAAAQTRFQNLTVNNAAGVVFSSSIQVNGDVIMTSGNATGPGPVTLAGNLTDSSGSRWRPTDTTLSGSPTILPFLITTNLTVTGDIFAPVSMELFGNLMVSGAGASLDFACRSWDIHGSLLTTSSGVIVMRDVSDCSPFVTVRGDATFNGGSTAGLLSAGTLDIDGNFSASTSSLTNFSASGNHVTRLSGSVLQTVSLSFPSPTQQHFQSLQIANPAGASFTSAVQINGNASITSGFASGAGPVTVAGSISDPSGSSWHPTSTIMSINGTPSLPASMTTNLTITGNFLAPYYDGTFTLIGDLTVSGAGAVFDINCRYWVVTGNFLTASSGVLKMVPGVECAGFLSIGGNATFNGGSTEGLLSSGFLSIGGNFSATASSTTNFAASGDHVTAIGTAGASTISMAFASPTQQRFHYLTLNATGGTAFTTAVQVNSDLVINESGVGNATGVGPVTLGGSLYDMIDNRWRVNATTLTSGSPYLPATMTTNLTFAPTSPPLSSPPIVTLDNDLDLIGNMTVTGTDAILNAYCSYITISGNLLTTAGARLRMVNDECNPNWFVGGNVTFAGGDETDLLTDGYLDVMGNFTATSSNTKSFVATSNHYVRFIGSGAQSISLAFPATASTPDQRFQNLTDFNSSAAGVTMLSDVYVSGAFDDEYCCDMSFAIQKIVGGGHTLTVGSAYVDGLDFDNVIFVLNYLNSDYYLHFGRVTFHGYSSSSTWITVKANSIEENFYGLVFQDPLPTSGHILRVDDNGMASFYLGLEIGSGSHSSITPDSGGGSANANTQKIGTVTVYWFNPG